MQLHLFSDKNYHKHTSPSLKRSYYPNGDGAESLHKYLKTLKKLLRLEENPHLERYPFTKQQPYRASLQGRHSPRSTTAVTCATKSKAFPAHTNPRRKVQGNLGQGSLNLLPLSGPRYSLAYKQHTICSLLKPGRLIRRHHSD